MAIAIAEGPRFDIGAIDFRGDFLGTPAKHLAMIRSRPGATFVERVAPQTALSLHYRAARLRAWS